jgi:SAM-dependent methyltransferase
MHSAASRIVLSVIYGTALHRWLGIGRAKFGQDYWDEKLNGPFRPYLGGTVKVETRNAVALALLALLAPGARRLLDVGCASGSLARAPGAERYHYTGTDISDVAISEGRRLSPDRRFIRTSLESFEPEGEFDAIIFNEVLYYLAPDAASAETRRYAGHLAAGGVLMVSMKHTAKSAAIFAGLSGHFDWVGGMLYQEKPERADYRVRVSAERPASLLALLRPKTRSESSLLGKDGTCDCQGFDLG